MNRIVRRMSLFLGLALALALGGAQPALGADPEESDGCVEQAAEQYLTCLDDASYFGKVLCSTKYIVDFWACAL